jgi:hypothetical protein
VIEPVGGPAALLAVALKVTNAPKVEGLVFELSATALAALFTV